MWTKVINIFKALDTCHKIISQKCNNSHFYQQWWEIPIYTTLNGIEFYLENKTQFANVISGRKNLIILIYYL